MSTVVTINQRKGNIVNLLQRAAARVFGLVALSPKSCDHLMKTQFDTGVQFGYTQGFHKGKDQAKIHFAVLPMPFTAEEMAGRMYGEFITPAGFGCVFGECNVPAPGEHGYEQSAYYVSKDSLVNSVKTSDLICHRAEKFENPADSHELVPVIVTVLR